jgi:predicted HTH transcriptional regulator
MSPEELNILLKSLRALPHETEWVEFKHNDAEPEEIGEYISALANSAALLGKDAGYVVWGIEDATHRVLGTSFKPRQRKVSGQELESWLTQNLTPRVHFHIHEFESEELPVVLFEICPANHTPVRFKDTEFIRVGSYKKKLKEFSEKERALWQRFARTPFETGIAKRNALGDEVLALLEYPKYFEMAGLALPANKQGILERLKVERFIVEKGGGQFDITNLGAILFAKHLSDFESLARKAVRVIRYKGVSRVETVKEKPGVKGYASGFEGLVGYINDQLPRNEVIGQALRKDVPMYPELAIRELVPNALIHQDFSITGTGPMVEIFDDRLEISNPGQPLIDTLRFIDHSPRSRNEELASIMRRLQICEERGSGIDKVIFQIELYQLPPPDFQTDETHTRVVLFAQGKLSEMDAKDKVRACYQHACLEFVSNRRMSNTSLRKRFAIADQNLAIASRIIKDTLKAGRIKPDDPDSFSRKHAKYIPFWA